MNSLKRFDHYVEKVIEWFLVATLLSVMVFSVLTIVLRWFQINLQWVEPLTRHLVFLSAFLGGAVATKKGNHIGIDILGKYLEAKQWHGLLKNIQRYIALVGFVTLIILTKASYDFMLVEKAFGGEAFFGLHSGDLVMIIPLGFLLIAYRFIYMFFISFEKETQV